MTAAAALALVLPSVSAASVSVNPTVSYDGAYTVSWTDASGGSTRAYLAQQINGGAWSTTLVTGTYSKAFSGMAVGNYSYKIQIYIYDGELRRYVLERQTNTATVQVTNLTAPGVPGAVSAPASSATGSYTVSWGAASGTVTRYDLYENGGPIYTGTALSAAISGRADGTYRYKAQACNSAGCSAFTAEAAVSVLYPPGTPTMGFSGSSGPDYTISWRLATGSVGWYELSESVDQVSWTARGGSSLAVTGKPLGTYYYRVRACNASGCGGYASATVTVTTYLTGPTQSSGSYTLSWNNRTGDDGELESRLAGGTFARAYKGPGTSYSFTRAADGIYEHRLRYCIPPEPPLPESCRPYGAIHAVDVQLPPSTPGALSATVNQNTGTYTVTWGASNGSGVGYWLETLNGSGSWVDVPGNPRSATPYTVSNAADGTYQYRVKACNRYCTGYAGPTSAVVLKLPTAPTNLGSAVDPTTGMIRVTWGASIGAVTRYVITETGTLLDGTPRTRVLYATVTTIDAYPAADGTFTYSVRGENGSGQGPAVSTPALQLLRVPGTPPSVSVPLATNTTGSYTVSWGGASGAVSRYDLYENGGATPVYSGTALTKSFAGKTDGSYGYKVQACNASGCSPLTAQSSVVVLLPPSTAPGPITGPSSSITGSYTLSWSAASGAVSRYELIENGGATPVYSGLSLSAAITGRQNGTYVYKVRACNASGCGAHTANFTVSVLRPPGTPGVISAPAISPGRHTLTWSPPASSVVQGYTLERSYAGGAFVAIPLGVVVTYTDTQLEEGAYAYRVSAWNASGSSSATSPTSVTVQLNLTEALPDQPVVAPSVPAQGWVGTIPGKPSADGGSAGYTLEIDVPPGRAGMQPQVALGYSSRNGNGIAGVGWSLSGLSSIYRCPRTLAQENGARPVSFDGQDRLCMDGKRLVQPANATGYGLASSEYRTEIDDFARITLRNADMGSQGSVFDVEHKSGLTSRYAAPGPTAPAPHAAWLLVAEWDRQLNCVAYEHQLFNDRGAGDQEWVLARIRYTGTWSAATGQCTLGADARSVELQYTSGRPDVRTTYVAGKASMLTARLDAIVTKVGGQAVRRYQLTYKESAATRRSLLEKVTLCAGATCGSEQLPPTTFTYQEDAATSFAEPAQIAGPDGTPLTDGWRVNVVGDYDGDGARDMLFAQWAGNAWHRTLQLSGDKTTYSVDSFFVGVEAPVQWHGQHEDLDLDADGRSDLIGWNSQNGRLVVTSLKNGQWVTVETNITVAAGSPRSGAGLARVADYDADGRLDLAFYDSTTGTTQVYRRTCNFGLQCFAPSFTIDRYTPDAGYQEEVSRDLNGDGLIDTVYDRTYFGGNYRPAAKVRFLTSSGAFTQLDMNQLGGPGDSFSSQAQRRWIDLNGDGLPDIYDRANGVVYVNRGGAPGAAIFVSRALTSPALDVKRAQLAFTMDVDADGQEELMVPNVRTKAYCGGDPTRSLPSGDPWWWCGDEFDRGDAHEEYDLSVFRWNAYKFRERADGTYEMVLVPTNLEAPVRSGPALADWPRAGGTGEYEYGDGIDDASYLLKKQYGTTSSGQVKLLGFYLGLSDATHGPYVSKNRARAPDLLTGVTNGLGATAAWSHQPLSRSDVPAECGGSFYLARHDDVHSPGYAFFTSSMWAVSKLDVSHGVRGTATPTNTSCYRYEDAMLNVQGRGFQGFKRITVEERLPPAIGEVPGAAGTCPTGACSANNLRTETEFNQEFPLTNRVKSVKVERVAGPKLLSFTTTSWNAVPARAPTLDTPGVWVVYPSATVASRFDLDPAGTLLVTKTSVNEVDVDSGEAWRSCSVVDDGLNATLSLEERKLTDEQSSWWLARLDARETVSDYLTVGWALTGSVPYSCPARPRNEEKVFRNTYAWFDDTSGSGFRRKLNYEALLRGATGSAEESRTTFPASTGYDAYGNPKRREVQGRDVVDASGVPLTLVSTYTTSADGYFIQTETNPAGHVATTQVDPATGNPIHKQAIQGSPVTTFAYDTIGRVLTSTTEGTQPVYERLAACVGVDCGNAKLSRQRIQAGAPAQTEFLDELGRVVQSEVEGLGGETIVVSRTSYNERGHKVVEEAPRLSGGAAFATEYSEIDAHGRVGRKTVQRDPALFATGKGDAVMTTDYVYAGLKTSITVHGSAAQGRELVMSRTYDGRGKLVETTQRVSSPTVHDIKVTYAYDPAGSVTLIQTSGSAGSGASITATYDDVGRKTSVNDPDRGHWVYVWDGLGRLRRQTDAKLTLTELAYDAIGRPVERHTTPAGQARQLDALWAYDQNGKLGTLSWEEGAGGGTTGDFRRDYRYDARYRVEKVTTAVGEQDALQAGGKRTFTQWLGYDRSFGRPKGTRSPGGDVVAFDYGERGHLLGEAEVRADGTRGKQYRLVRGLSPRGQVTDEVFGNCVVEAVAYEGSVGLVTSMTAVRPTGLGALPANLTQCPQPVGPLIRQVDYAYDHYLNLDRQVKNVAGVQATETFEYDELHRLTRAARSWVGVTAGAEADTYGYDDLGNIRSKSDYGTSYAYGDHTRLTRNAGPHAVAAVTRPGGQVVEFTYDLNGNLVSGDGRTITFDLMDRAVTVTQGASATTTSFAYAPDGGRYRQRVTGGAEAKYGPKTVYYVAKDYELTVWDDGTAEERTYVGGSVVVYRKNAGPREVRYEHKDRLGSLDAVTADDAVATELYADAHGFDPWGKPRGRDWRPSEERLYPAGDKGATTDRGFTGHEHLDAHYLIHMNGRVYDYRLGRFLSVDPIISNPMSSQSVNPYSYIGNNPLSGTDPTGYTDMPPPVKGSTGIPATTAPTRAGEGGGESTKTVSLFMASKQERSVAYAAQFSASNLPSLPGSITVATSGATGIPARQDGTAGRPADANSPSTENARSSTANAGFNLGHWAGKLALDIGHVLKDTATGIGKEAWNTAAGTANTINAPIDYALSYFTDFRFGQVPLLEGSTPGERSAMAGALVFGSLTGPGGARLAAKAATAAERGVAVLGHYPGYVTMAENIGARYFNVPAEVWTRMPPAEQWAANVRFLDRLISRGDTVVLSTPASAARAGSWFARELEYLSSRGYSLSADGTRMLPRGP